MSRRPTGFDRHQVCPTCGCGAETYDAPCKAKAMEPLDGQDIPDGMTTVEGNAGRFSEAAREDLRRESDRWQASRWREGGQPSASARTGSS